jgi:hypothetical protein
MYQSGFYRRGFIEIWCWRVLEKFHHTVTGRNTDNDKGYEQVADDKQKHIAT